MRSSNNFSKSSRFFTAAFLFLIPFFLQAENYVLKNDGIIGEKTVIKINEIGKELFDKDNISVYVFVGKSLNNASMKEYIDSITQDLRVPYALLFMLSDDKIIDIVSSSEVSGKFDKTQILSPIPYHGTIRPLLVIKKDYDGFSAAILNGYADIVEQIAKSDGIQLENALGDANKETLFYIRIIVYALFILAFFIYIYKKVKYRHAKNK